MDNKQGPEGSRTDVWELGKGAEGDWYLNIKGTVFEFRAQLGPV